MAGMASAPGIAGGLDDAEAIKQITCGFEPVDRYAAAMSRQAAAGAYHTQASLWRRRAGAA